MADDREKNDERSDEKEPLFSASAEDVTASSSGSTEEMGTQVGPYKLLGTLGEGGYGIVHLAEQEQPIRRRVAVKVIKPGMDSMQVVARFEAERQALALLDHPNIAHIYDAGTTPKGRPYFAMEYIKGIPITQYCDKYKLNTEERLRLFIPLCQAIQHAHHKGIIHRDIKPSNVLVMLHDDKPIAKIIDFGVAKALNQRLTQKTLFTEQGRFLGTPEYMSPEQAELTGLDVDTRTDVYSLGVLLYELLTGCTPFDPEDLRSKGYAQMQRIICEQEPVTPSTKLTALGDKLEDVAKHRSATVEQLRKSVKGELDWIVMKAMEKDRTRRYDTANGLAMDVQHYLKNEPVTASPPSKLYRLQKLVRRNRSVFAGVAAVAAALLMALTISIVSLVREQHAHQLTVAAQEKEAASRRQIQAEAYASDMSLAQQVLAANDLGRARRLLEAHRPAPGELDLRGWEWRYLWQECQSDARQELCRYPDSTFSVAYSPNGRVLAVAGFSPGFVDIWDVPSRRRLATLQPKKGRFVAFSPQGDMLATYWEKQIRLWRIATKDLVGELTIPGFLCDLKFSPDGTRLASLSTPDEIAVWEVDRWTIVRNIRGVRGQSPDLGSIDFSPDGKIIVAGGRDYRLRAVDVASGETVFDILEAHREPITCVAWSPNGSVIASGSGYTGGPIRLWDAAGKPLGELAGHTSWISQLVFSADSRRLYSASADQTIRIWDVGQQRCLTALRGSGDEVWGLALSPDGATLASSTRDGVVAFWDANPGWEEEQPKLIALGQPAGSAFSPGSRALATMKDGTVSLLDIGTLEETKKVGALGAEVSKLAYSPDGALLVSASRSGEIRVWSCSEHRMLRELRGNEASVDLLCFRAEGRRLLSLDAKGKLIWWDTLTWQPVRTFTVGVEPFWGGIVSPNGRLLVGGGVGSVHWLDAETGEFLMTTTGSHRHKVLAVAFSDDGLQAASTSIDGTVAIWDSSSFQPTATFKGHMQGAHGVAFSPDGRRLATGGNGRDAVKLWDLSTLRELVTLPGQGFLFQSVGFSPDGRWLAACSSEGNLHLWAAPSWEEIEAEEKKLESRQSP